MTETRTEAGAGAKDKWALYRCSASGVPFSGWHSSDILKLLAEIDTLTAELHDAEAERDRMREALEMLLTIHPIQHLAVLATKEKQARAALSGGKP